jgi:hypothetical protein
VILTLLWKEYREHRSIWLTMVLLTGLFGFLVVRLSDPRGVAAASYLGLAVLGMAAAYGVVCGAMMLAGEREGGTLVFLEIFLGRRGILWLWKWLIGAALAVTEALAVALVLHLLKEGPPAWLAGLVGRTSSGGFGGGLGPDGRLATHYWFLVLPLVTLEAYAWGLMGSAMTRHVLVGAGVAILIAAPIWLVAVLPPAPVSLGLRLVAAGGALAVSLTVFQTQALDAPLAAPARADGRPDRRRLFLDEWERDRREVRRRAPQMAREDEPLEVIPVHADEPPAARRVRLPTRGRVPEASSPGQVLLWLTFRQAPLVLIVLAALALLVGLGVPAAGPLLWPAATLLLGVACGVATFAQEQNDLSYQFLAAQHFPLRTVWRVKLLFWATAAALACLLVVLGGALAILVSALRVRQPVLDEPAPARLAFAFGTLRQVLGPVLYFGVWLVYGFCAGQLCVWLCRKSVLAVLLAGVVALGGGSLWLPSLLCLGMSGWQVWVPALLALLATRALVRAWAGGRIKERKPLLALAGFALVALAWAGLVFVWRMWEVPDPGEPLDPVAFRAALGDDNRAAQKIQQALAEMENPDARPGAWVVTLGEAARLPVGVIETPRKDGQESSLLHLPACRTMTEKLRALASAALGAGRPAGAVDYLGHILALSRNLRNKAPVASYLAGVDAEASALQGLDEVLAHGKPAPELLRRILDELNRHAAETPPALDCLQTECYRARGLLERPTNWSFHTGPDRVPEKWLADGIALSLQTPWEDERKARLWRAVWAGLFQAVRTPYWQLPGAAKGPEFRRETTRDILEGWLPPAEGPSLTRERLARLLDDSWLSDMRLFAPVVRLRGAVTRAQWRVEAHRLKVALGLYQLRERKAAQRLEDLVPKYLPTLPLDPYSGQGFRYRISKGEDVKVEGPGGPGPVRAQLGQGIVWSTGPDRTDDGGRAHAAEVPDEDPLWRRGGLDLVTVVPRWP